MMRRWLVGWLHLAAVAGCAVTISSAVYSQDSGGPMVAASSSTPTYTLAYKYVAGQIRNYQCTIEITGTVGTGFGSQALNNRSDTLFTQSIQSVRSDGFATILTHIISAQSTENGVARPYSDDQIAAMQPPNRVVGPDGRVEEITPAKSTETGDVRAYMNIGQTQSLPDDPVGLNESWRSTMDAMGLTLYTRSTLQQVTPADDGALAQIATKYYGTTGQAGMHPLTSTTKLYVLTTGNGVVEFNIATGTLQSATTTLETQATVTPPKNATGAAAQNGPVKLRLTARIHLELLGNDETGQ